MTNWEVLQSYLPAEWVEALCALPVEVANRVQEVRLRSGQPLTVSLPEGERYVHLGGVTDLRQTGLFICSKEAIEDCFLRFCDHSVYAHQWELSQGYLSVPGGIRVGVAGTAVVRQGEIASVQAVTGLCVRMPRSIRGCAGWLQRVMLSSGYPTSTLVVGEPSSGKTTLLRDLALGMAADHRRVAVVDERGELAGAGGLPGCDVLLGYPKAEGIRQAIRCLAPEVVLFDELGDEKEAEAVAACAHAGVAVVATLHGRTTAELEWRSTSRGLLEQRAFSLWAFLSGRRSPGEVSGIYQPEVQTGEVCWVSVDFSVRDRDRGVCRSSLASKGELFTAHLPSAADSVATDGIHRTPYERVVATVG